MAGKTARTKGAINYTAYGYQDGQSMYHDMRATDENRRHRVLKAARELQGQSLNIEQYLDGLEAGTRKAGASALTATRLRYEVAAVIAAYAITVDEEIPSLGADGQQSSTEKIRLDRTTLEAERTWQGLVNTARRMRSVATSNRDSQEGLPQRIGRGNHTARKFEDRKFDELRVQLLERTAPHQVLNLLDTAIMAVAHTYTQIASNEVETLKEALQRLCEKIHEINLQDRDDKPSKERPQWVA